MGVQSFGGWGAGLARWLRHESFVAVEADRINRPNRRTRRRHGGSDTVDGSLPPGWSNPVKPSAHQGRRPR